MLPEIEVSLDESESAAKSCLHDSEKLSSLVKCRLTPDGEEFFLATVQHRLDNDVVELGLVLVPLLASPGMLLMEYQDCFYFEF